MLFNHDTIDSYELNLSEKFKSNLIDQLKQNFFNISLLNNIDSTTNNISLNDKINIIRDNLKLFQYDLIKKRNLFCSNESNHDWSFIKFKNKTDLLHLLSNFTSNDYLNNNNKVANSFNHMVSSKFFHICFVDNSRNFLNIIKCFGSDALIDFFDPKSNQDFNDIFQVVLSQFNNEGCNLCGNTVKDKVQITKLESNFSKSKCKNF